MLPIITKILRVLPGFDRIFDKLDDRAAEAEKIKAEAELADIKGFHKTGRVSAKHFWNYTKCVIAIAVVILFGVGLFHPTASTNFDAMWNSFIGGVKQLFEVNL